MKLVNVHLEYFSIGKKLFSSLADKNLQVNLCPYKVVK